MAQAHVLRMCEMSVITRHSLVRAKGEVFVLLYVFFVCLFGQRFLDKARPIQAKFCMRAYSGSKCVFSSPFGS